MARPTRFSVRPSSRRAFSMIELLVVISIIALVIALVIPSLGGARNAARAAATRGLMNNITQAAAQFERDERRMPGYFSARDMGHAENADRGFSAMQNVMLDLAGGIVGTSSADTLEVGPRNGANQVSVNPAYIGVEREGNKMYWIPDSKNFVPQTDGNQQAATHQAHRTLPSVIDAFGSPILAWVMDETTMGKISELQQFARVQSPQAGQAGARFYWNSNAAFLNATGLGRWQTDQTTANVRAGSLIGGGVPDASRARSLAGILGHPSYPVRPPETPELPAAPRGSFVVHSAGADAVYLSRRDRGARQFTMPDIGAAIGANHFINYQNNFVTPGGHAYLDRDNREVNIDVLEQFDDLIVVGGN